MFSLFLALAALFCMILQGPTRNLLFFMVGVMALIAYLLVNFSRFCRVKWPFVLAVVLGNGALAAYAIIRHLATGGIVYDYLFCAIIPLLCIALATLDILTRKEKTSRE